jgi:hypothetical protein
MGTHAMIGIWNPETDEVTASYVHYDGYVKGGVGETLVKHYHGNLLASTVATGGYLSSLSENYARDRAEAVHVDPAEKYKSVEEYLKEGWDYAAAHYMYLWDGEAWFGAARGEKFTDVETLLGRN